MSWSDTTPAPNVKAAAMHLTADNHHAENFDDRDCVAADARPRAAITPRSRVTLGDHQPKQLLNSGLDLRAIMIEWRKQVCCRQ
jgi:hypothetical protein